MPYIGIGRVPKDGTERERMEAASQEPLRCGGGQRQAPNEIRNDLQAPLVDLKKLKALARKQVLRGFKLPEFVGQQLAPATNLKRGMVTDDHPDAHVAEAWDIPALRSKYFAVESETCLYAALHGYVQEVLQTRLVYDSRHEDFIVGPVRKYGILHMSLCTDVPSGYSTPFFVEVYGPLLRFGGVDIDDPNAESIHSSGNVRAEVPGPLVFRVDTAIWSNLTFPGIGVPFYM